MNVIALLHDLESNQIQFHGIKVNNESKSIELSLKIYNTEIMSKAHDILRAHAKELFEYGFTIEVYHAMSF